MNRSVLPKDSEPGGELEKKETAFNTQGAVVRLGDGLLCYEKRSLSVKTEVGVLSRKRIAKGCGIVPRRISMQECGQLKKNPRIPIR